MKKRDKALVPYKTCPKCGGAGRVPCNGREYWHQLAREWANSMHGRMVMIPFFTEDRKWTQIPGLAIRGATSPGGWGGIKVYISMDKAPNWGGFGLQRYGYEEEHDIINGHKIYYITKGRPQRKDVIPIDLDDIQPNLKEVMRLVANYGEVE